MSVGSLASELRNKKRNLEKCFLCCRLQTAYFAQHGLACPPEYNPADYFLDVVSMDYRSLEAEESCRERVRLLAAVYRQERAGLAVSLRSPPLQPCHMMWQFFCELWSSCRLDRLT